MFLKFEILHFLVSKNVVIKAENNKMVIRIVNREDPGQTVSEEAVWSWYALFV